VNAQRGYGKCDNRQHSGGRNNAKAWREIFEKEKDTNKYSGAKAFESSPFSSQGDKEQPINDEEHTERGMVRENSSIDAGVQAGCLVSQK